MRESQEVSWAWTSENRLYAAQRTGGSVVPRGFRGPLSIVGPVLRRAPEPARIQVNRFGGLMKATFFALFLSVVSQPLLAQGAPPHSSPDQPYIMECFNAAGDGALWPLVMVLGGALAWQLA